MFASIITAHPGSGIVVDKQGQVYFTDTGKGVWKIDANGKLTYLPSSRFHWMAIDEEGYFKDVQKSFGGSFERVTPQGSKPVIVICSDFPFTFNKDGNIYYAFTNHNSPKIIRRTPGGKETVLASDKSFEFISGIAADADGVIYITEQSNPDENTIRKITMDGKMTIVARYAGRGVKEVPLDMKASYCRGLAIDPSGNIYVAATGSRCILKITPDGKMATILKASTPWTPTGVILYRGEMYVLEWHDVVAEKLEVREAWLPRVRKMGRNGNIITIVTVTR